MVTEQERDSQSGDLAAGLRLRPERPPVTRLSRKVLVGLAAIAAVVVSGALVWSSSPLIRRHSVRISTHRPVPIFRDRLGVRHRHIRFLEIEPALGLARFMAIQAVLGEDRIDRSVVYGMPGFGSGRNS